MNTLFLNLLTVSVPLAAVTAILLLVFAFSGKRVTAKCRYLIWTAVIIRLCIPFGTVMLPSALNISLPAEVGFAADIEDGASSDTDISSPLQGTNETDHASPITESVTPEAPVSEEVPDIGSHITADTAKPSPSGGNISYADKKGTDTETPEAAQSAAEPFKLNTKTALTVTSYVWLIFALLCFIWHIVSYNISTQKIIRSSHAPSEDDMRVYGRLCKSYNIGRAPELIISKNASSPMICGYFRPKIILPDIELSGNAKAGTLAHELTHYKRHDLYMKLLCVIAKSLHWFNPLAYIAAKRCNAEMELSCDERLLSGLDENARRSYGGVMLDIIRKNSGNTENSGSAKNINGKNILSGGSLTTQFNPKKQAVKERFYNIMDMTKKKRGIWMIAAAAVLCVIAGAVIGCNIGGKTLPEGHRYVEGLYLRCDNNGFTSQSGSDMIIIEGYNGDGSYSPCVMTAENENVSFSDLTDGDRIKIEVMLIGETYPMQTEVYSVEKLSDGSRSDINADVLSELAELGWLKTDESTDESGETPNIIPEKITELLWMPVSEIVKRYGEMTLEYSEAGPGYPVYSIETLPGVTATYIWNMDDPLLVSMLPNEIIITEDYEGKIAGITAGESISGTDIAWKSASYSVINGTVTLSFEIGNHLVSAVLVNENGFGIEEGEDSSDFDEYIKTWEAEFIKNPAGNVAQIRIRLKNPVESDSVPLIDGYEYIAGNGSIRLYVESESINSGNYNFALTYKSNDQSEHRIDFTGSGYAVDKTSAFAPRVYPTDINADYQYDIAVVFTTETGVNTHKEELRAFLGDLDTEITTESAAPYINKTLQITSDSEKWVLRSGDVGYIVGKAQFSDTYSDDIIEKPSLDSNFQYHVLYDGIYCDMYINCTDQFSGFANEYLRVNYKDDGDALSCVSLSMRYRNGGTIETTSDKMFDYLDMGSDTDYYTLCITDAGNFMLDVRRDESNTPFAAAVSESPEYAQSGKVLDLGWSMQLYGNFSIDLFRAEEMTVFSKLYYGVGDTYVFSGGEIHEMHYVFIDGKANEIIDSAAYGSGYTTYLYEENGKLRYCRQSSDYSQADITQTGFDAVASAIKSRDDFFRSYGSFTLDENGKGVFTEDKRQTISDAYDLDAEYASWREQMTFDTPETLDEWIEQNNASITDFDNPSVTGFTDESWAKLNYDGKISDQCKTFFYNFVSGKSEIPEYNALGIKDWKITRNGTLFDTDYPSFIFEFTVTGDSLDALPPGKYLRYVRDIRWTVMYGEDMITPVAKEQNTGNKYANAVYSYLTSAYIWDCCDFGKWGSGIPINYIIGQHGASSIPYADFLSEAKRIFGIETVDEERYSGFIYDSDGVKMIQEGGVGGGYFANIPDVTKNGDNYEVTVQLYADINGILPSHKLRYTLGENCEFYKFEVIEESPYEPEGLYRYYTLPSYAPSVMSVFEKYAVQKYDEKVIDAYRVDLRYTCQFYSDETIFTGRVYIPHINSEKPTAKNLNDEIDRHMVDLYSEIISDIGKTGMSYWSFDSTYEYYINGDIITVSILNSRGKLGTGACGSQYLIYHYDTVNDRLLDTDEFLAYYYGDGMTLAKLLEAANAQEINVGETNNCIPLTESDVQGVLPSPLSDKGIDLCYQGFSVEARFATRQYISDETRFTASDGTVYGCNVKYKGSGYYIDGNDGNGYAVFLPQNWDHSSEEELIKGGLTLKFTENGYVRLDISADTADGRISTYTYLPTSATSISSLDEWEKFGLTRDDYRYKYFSAFLSKDTKSLETQSGYESGMFDSYKQLEFGDYTLEREKSEYSSSYYNYSISVEITKGTEALPAGNYKFVLQEYPRIYLQKVFPEDPGGGTLYETTKELLNAILDYKLDFADLKESSSGLTEYIVKRISATGKKHITKINLADYAKKYFGINDFVPSDNCLVEGGFYEVPAHGGNRIICEFVSDGVDEITGEYLLTVRFFADLGKTVQSHLVQYRASKIDGDTAFLGYEIIEKEQFEPFKYAV